jgi:hypothetical protein
VAVITRSQWGAGPHRAGTIRLPVSRLFLHHTVTPQWTGAAAGRQLQSIARGRGFIDISYSWLVDVAGNEIEGRGWGRAGAHTAGYNSTAHAISLVGNFDIGPLPAAMIRGVVRLIRNHRVYGPGRITHSHSDVASTACPGRFARAQIPSMNRSAAGTAPPPPPPSTPAPPPPERKGFLSALNSNQQLSTWRGARQVPALRDEVRDVRRLIVAVAQRVNSLPTLPQTQLGIIQTLHPNHQGQPVRIGDLNADAKRQLRMLLQAELARLKDS